MTVCWQLGSLPHTVLEDAGTPMLHCIRLVKGKSLIQPTSGGREFTQAGYQEGSVLAGY